MKPADLSTEPPWNSDEGLSTVNSCLRGEADGPRGSGLLGQFRRMMRRMPRDVGSVLLRRADPAGPPLAEDDDSIEIVADRGSPIYSAADGVVIRAGIQGGLGVCIAIRHADGHVTRYAHCDERLVKRDDLVKRGQVIGRVGATGLAPEPLLRFDVIGPGGRYVDPYRYLRRCDEG
jgi:hypothetical protein